MTRKNRLKNKKILIVDDESDVLETLEDLLSMCRISTARTFEDGKALLETQEFDVAILDIMGVKGYELLDVAVRRNIPAVMLTAHALRPESIVTSYKKGAATFIPKEEMSRITSFLEDVLAARSKGISTWLNWLDMLTDTYWQKKFGADWKEKDRQFWDNFPKRK